MIARLSFVILLTALLTAAFSGIQAGRAAPSQGTLDMRAFAGIPVLHEGRVKTMARFAQIERELIAGRPQRGEDVAWLAEAIFDPQRAAARPIMLIANAELRARAGLDDREGRLYSLSEITPFLAQTQSQALSFAAQDRNGLTAEQRALVLLHDRALSFGQLLQAMTSFLPMQVSLPPGLEIEAAHFSGQPTFLEIRKRERQIENSLKALVARKGDDPRKYDETETALALLGFEFRNLQQAGNVNHLLRVIPPQWAGGQETGEWQAPWALLASGGGGPQSVEILGAWQDMAIAYRTGNQTLWAKASAKARQLALAQGGGAALERRLMLEAIYSSLNPFILASLGYGICLILVLAARLRPLPALKILALAAAGGGAAAHLSGIALRVAILQRPPVGSLYESMLFVALVIAAVALAGALRRRDPLTAAGGAAAALLLLFLAPAIAPRGDDLEMLVAVLNTNFWLATHVTVITAGYGFCVLTSLPAHLYLLRAGNPGAGRTAGELTGAIYRLSLAALLLTAVGTVLGGIWADQSWGRFWGWDPKENGALLIVLWLIWLHHGRHAGKLDMALFAAGMAFLNVIVALAWFGVNLLNVGLHSYGFISGIAAGLAIFCTAQTLVIALLYFRARRNRTVRT